MLATLLEMIRKAEMTYARQKDAVEKTQNEIAYLYNERDKLTNQTDLTKKK